MKKTNNTLNKVQKNKRGEIQKKGEKPGDWQLARESGSGGENRDATTFVGKRRRKGVQ